MIKLISLNLIFAFAMVILAITVGEEALTTTYKSWETAQSTSAKTQDKLLEVAVPELATVTLKEGNSYTGGLKDFNSKKLTLSAYSHNKTFSLSQIGLIEFNVDDVWIRLPDGTRKRLRVIRGLTQTLEGVPVKAFKLGNAKDKAVLNLDAVLTNEQFARLSSNLDGIYVIKEIEFESGEKMMVKIKKASTGMQN